MTATERCLANWRELSGAWPPIRIGGTTQDRALYDAATDAYVVYSVADPRDAPMSLTYGPRFLTLAGAYGGSVVVGLNRGRDQLANTIDAARRAVDEVGDRLLALELGNEPECESSAPSPFPSSVPATLAISLLLSLPLCERYGACYDDD